MKQTIISLCFILFSVIAFSQTQHQLDSTKKADSIFTKKVLQFNISVADTISLKSFREWAYKNISAEQFNLIAPVMDTYLNKTFEAWLQTKAKPK